MPSLSADPQTILFLAANPKNTARLRLDQELLRFAQNSVENANLYDSGRRDSG